MLVTLYRVTIEEEGAMKVVLSADAFDGGRCGLEWCLRHLGGADTVLAVVGLPPSSGFVLGVPVIDPVETEHELLIQTERAYCEPIRAAGPCARPGSSHPGRLERSSTWRPRRLPI
jgi:hypothetical protein